MRFQNNIAPNATPGQYIQVNAAGRVIRILDNAPGSWSTITYFVNSDGSLSRVY